MASIVLTNNAKFTPYTFDEMLKPLAMATQEQRAIEEGISELGSKADLMRMYANEEPNSKVASMYNTYANDLDKQAEALAKSGLNPASRKGLLDLKRRYSSEITPIETAVTRRRQLAEEQRKARAQDDSILFDVDARTISLDDLVGNPELSYTSVSGKNIMENVSKAASVLAKEARNDPNKFNSMLDGDYYEYVKQYGFSKEAVMDAILRSKNASNILTSIVDDALASSGVGKNWAGNAYDRALDYANRGLWSAVGQTQTQLVDNWRAKLQEQHRLSKVQDFVNKGLSVNPLNIYSHKEQTNADKNIREFSKYFEKDAKGNTVLSKLGKEELSKPAKTAYSHARQEDVVATSAFSNFLTEKLGVVDNTSTKDIAKLWNDYVNSHTETKYDATKITEWDYRLDPSKKAQDIAKGAIMTANRGIEELTEVDYDNKSGAWLPTGNKLSHEDLLDDKYTIISRRPSLLGETVMIRNDKGEVKRYTMPKGIHSTSEAAMSEILRNLPNIYTILQNPNLSEKDRANLELKYAQYINSLHMFESQKDMINTTEAQEFKPYSI